MTLVYGIFSIFFLKSIIPTLLGGFGVRETVTLLVFTPFVDGMETVLLPSLILWLLNIVIPSIVGFFPILNFKG